MILGLQVGELRFHREIEPTTFGKGYKVIDYCFARIRLARDSISAALAARFVFRSQGSIVLQNEGRRGNRKHLLTPKNIGNLG